MGWAITLVLFWLSAAVAYITHLIWSITLLTSDTGMVAIGKMVLAGLGLILPPVGIIHGVMVWFGAGG